jgi:hypothetical protein
VKEQVAAFASGFIAGVVVVGVVAYITAPTLAEAVTVRAVNRQSSRLLGLPDSLTRGFAAQLGAMVRQETEKALAL